MDVTVLIPYYNGREFIAKALGSLPPEIEAVVVDDVSDAPLDQAEARTWHKRTRVLRLPVKGYFSGAVNAGAAAIRGDFVVMNQDAYLRGTAALDALVQVPPDVATVGDGVFDHPAWPKGYVQGTWMFIRRAAWDAVGPLNVADYPLWGATCEWQLRACRLGYRAQPLATVPGFVHDEHRFAEGRRFGKAVGAVRKSNGTDERLLRTPPELTVVVPCFNYGRYIADCVHSLIGGSTSLGAWPAPRKFSAFDVIVVDDASTDGQTPEQIKAVVDPRCGVRAVFHEVNRGCPAANNRGIKTSRAPFFTILSADDMREPDSLARLMDVVRENPAVVPYDDIRIFGHGRRRELFPLPEYDFKRMTERNCMHPGIVCSRVAWQKAGGYAEVMRDGREDWAFNVALGVQGFCGKHLAEPGLLYRREGQNRTLHNTSPKHIAHFRDLIKGLYPQAYEEGFMAGCCGEKNTVRGATPKAAGASTAKGGLPGGSGMVQVRYVGTNWGTMTYMGPVTKHPYRFGLNRPVGYVATEDAPGMVAMRGEHGEKLFALATPASPKAPAAPLPAPVVEAKAPAGRSLPVPPQPPRAPEKMRVPSGYPSPPPPVAPPPAPKTVLITFDPTPLTARDVIAFANKSGKDPVDWRGALRLEQQGKNRPTVVNALRRAAGDEE